MPSRRRRIRRSWQRSVATLDEMAALAGEPGTPALRAPAISSWSVGQQLEHLVLADRGILRTIGRLAAGELDEGGGPSLVGRLVLLTRFIPRGGAKAPGVLHPQGIPDPELGSAIVALSLDFRALEPDLDRLAGVSATSRHPILGRFNPRRWLRFVDLHHRHHLRIVADIRRAAEAV